MLGLRANPEGSINYWYCKVLMRRFHVAGTPQSRILERTGQHSMRKSDMADTTDPGVTILGIAGSLRRDSYNRAALRVAQTLTPENSKIAIFEIDGIPLYNQDEEKNLPAKVVELKARIRAADAVLFATPEYNHSVAGVLKNVIDWGSRPHGDNAWSAKPAAILGVSTGMLGTARAQSHLREILVSFNMLAVNQPEVLIGGAASRFDAAGNLTDANSRQLIAKLLTNLVAWTRLLKGIAG
jgi:chromate reductase